MDLKPHFLALLTYLTAEDGGRKTPAISGFRPGIKFPFNDDIFVSIQTFIDTDLAFPGDIINAEITLINTEYFNGKIYEGLDFDFFEGPTLIGHGVIKRILNPELS